MQLVVALKRLDLIKNCPEIRQNLWSNVNNLQKWIKRTDLI